jgi:hypothetical protein
MCLRDEHSVERIPVVSGHQTGLARMLYRYRQGIEVLAADDLDKPFCDLDRAGKLADTNLGGNFPRGRGADEYSGRRGADGRSGGLREPRIPVEPPEEGVCVEKKLQSLLPCVQFILGQGLEKSFVDTSFPAVGAEPPSVRCRLDWRQPYDRPSGLGDGHFLSITCAFDELGQLRLGVVDVDLNHLGELMLS